MDLLLSLEDPEAIQCALANTINAILADKIDAKKPELILYALQTAASNVARSKFQPYWSDVVTAVE